MQQGPCTIESRRLWEDRARKGMSAGAWSTAEDFGKARAAARKFFPEPPRKAPPPEERVLGLIETVLKETSSKETGLKESSTEVPKPAVQNFDMHIDGWPAKFVPQWRIRIKR